MQELDNICTQHFSVLQVLNAIDEEPEYPGTVPSDVQGFILQMMENKDIDAFVYLMRYSVRETKKGIKERLGLPVNYSPI